MSEHPPAEDPSTDDGAATTDVAAADGDAPPATDAPSGGRRVLRWALIATGTTVALVVLAGVWLWQTTELPPPPSAAQSAVLLDRNGDELAVLAQDGLRIQVTLEEVAPPVVDALLAAEDRRFYDHTGIDPVGIGRAFWNNLRNDDVQGGSTITQQLVKNVYLNSDRSISRKVREAVLSVKLERSEDKDEILERYLNTVYFGRGAYGIEAAARAYFRTGSPDLSLEQAALLAGILRSPEALDPADAPDAALARRNQVLEGMVETGVIERDEADAAIARPIEVVGQPSPTTLSAGVAPHFVEHVRAQIVAQFGERALYEDGLIVHTTLDIPDQRAAEAAVATHLDDPDDPQAAVVGVDGFGAVRAWVGGRDFEELQLDLVSDDAGSGRQPGSTFKPIVLAAHLAEGFGAAQRFPAPSQMTFDLEPEPWKVSNAGGSGYGSLTLAQATVNSVNTVYAQAVLQVGADKVADLARELGVDRELRPEPSIALGTQEVTPLEMATVFSTFSRGGGRIDPYVITRIETRSGDVVHEAGPEVDQVLEPGVANTVNAILSDSPRRGTATRAALDRPMAAKTGTTQRNADAWLAGYTPNYTAIVWMGNVGSNEPMERVDGQRVFGGSIPAMIWHDFMAGALEDVEPLDFGEPDDALLRGRSGAKKAVKASDRTRTTRSDLDSRPTTTTTAPPTTSTSEPGETGETDDAAETDEAGGDEVGDTGEGDTATTTTSSTTTTTTTTTTSPTTAPPTTSGTDSESSSTDSGTTDSG